MVNQNKVTNREAGRSPKAIRLAQFTVTDVSQVSPSLAIDCLCSSQSPKGLWQSSGKEVLKNQAGCPPWISSWRVKPVEELLREFIVSTAQGTRRT